mmetsp:Transcript_12254/g.17981  ORF Transcript_12254/g.17981 Transcript_12254/m.17981 type:complete len:541 (+) Transcript_12254:128-1750(+)
MSDEDAILHETPNKGQISSSIDDLIDYIEKADWENVKDCLKDNPKFARQEVPLELEGSSSQGYPLHLAVSKNPPSRVILSFLQAFLNAIKIREERWGRLPIHIACRCHASVDVLKVLIAAHQESLRITDKVYSRLPLHYACQFASPEEISVIVNAERRALVFKDADGKTPMDLALTSNHPKQDVIIKNLEERTLQVADAIIQGRKGNAPKPRRKSSAASVDGYRPERKSARDRKGKRLSRKSSSEFKKDVENSKTSDDVYLEKQRYLRDRIRKTKRITPYKSPQPVSTEESDTNMTPKQSNSLQSRGGSSSSGIYSHDQMSSLHLSPLFLHHDKHDLKFVTPTTAAESTQEVKVEHSPETSKKNSNLATFLQGYAEEKIRLARFLQQYAFDNENKSVRSVPTLLGYPSESVAQNLVFDDSEDDEMEEPQNREESNTPRSNRTEEISRVDEKISTLQDIRQNLRFEYESMFEKASKAEKSVEKSKNNIHDLKLEVARLQTQLEKESLELAANENSRQAHMKALIVQEKKINDINRCIRKHL